MKKEVFESGHIHRERGRRTLPEGTDNDGSSLSKFMHSTARDKFLPLLGTNCRIMNAKVTAQKNVIGGLLSAVFSKNFDGI